MWTPHSWDPGSGSIGIGGVSDSESYEITSYILKIHFESTMKELHKKVERV